MIWDENKKHEYKFGACRFCHQERVLEWVLAGKKDGGLWSGWICHECYLKAQEGGGDP